MTYNYANHYHAVNTPFTTIRLCTFHIIGKCLELAQNITLYVKISVNIRWANNVCCPNRI